MIPPAHQNLYYSQIGGGQNDFDIKREASLTQFMYPGCSWFAKILLKKYVYEVSTLKNLFDM